jgi:sugar/nucleoside kinase (ribokinase family)
LYPFYDFHYCDRIYEGHQEWKCRRDTTRTKGILTLLRYEELIKNYPVEYIAGGAGQNSIRACQWMLQAPKATTYLGCVGNDDFGKKLKEAAEKDGVTPHYLVDEATPTGTCAVLVTDKER